MKHRIFLALALLAGTVSVQLEAAGPAAPKKKSVGKPAPKKAKKKSQPTVSDQALIAQYVPADLQERVRQNPAVLNTVRSLLEEGLSKEQVADAVRTAVEGSLQVRAGEAAQQAQKKEELKKREAWLINALEHSIPEEKLKKILAVQDPERRNKMLTAAYNAAVGKEQKEATLSAVVASVTPEEIQNLKAEIANRKHLDFEPRSKALAERLAALNVNSTFREKIDTLMARAQEESFRQRLPDSLQRLREKLQETIEAEEYEHPDDAAKARQEVANTLNNMTKEYEETRDEFMQAAKDAHYEPLKESLDNGYNVNTTDGQGNTALMVAANHGHREVVRYLHERGANVNAQNNHGITALMLAVQQPHEYPDVVDYLVRLAHADTTLKNENGQTALDLAGREARNALIVSGQNPQVRPQAPTATPAAPAGKKKTAKKKSKKVVKKKKSAAAPSASAASAADLGNQLIRAALNSDGPMLQAAITDGADVNYHDPVTGDTALMQAAHNGDRANVENLLLPRYHADPNATNSNGDTALMRAAERNHPAIVTMLLNAQAQKNAQNQNGNTALMLAANADAANTVNLLLKAGADINIRNRDGKTAKDLAPRGKTSALLNSEARYEGFVGANQLAQKAEEEVQAKEAEGGITPLFASEKGEMAAEQRAQAREAALAKEEQQKASGGVTSHVFEVEQGVGSLDDQMKAYARRLGGDEEKIVVKKFEAMNDQQKRVFLKMITANPSVLGKFASLWMEGQEPDIEAR
ncbi:MAG TPA: ankyrin repeat domain-containing protein [Candidatus Limnocylindria bacterium]|nr:ankyrin repeat domain-containing protein [Candidatus Limnocylindria bacterium]